MPSLPEIQRTVWRLIRAPEGVAPALAAMAAAGEPLAGGLESLVLGDERMSAVERLEVYANMYFFRILDVLKEDYPALLAAVGDAAFHDLVTAYLIEHPSTHPSIRWVGRHLPSFLARRALGRERPWLADLARLEWAILDAFDSPDAAPLGADRLAALCSEEWPGARFRFTPSLAVLECGWPVDRLWDDAVHGRELQTPPARPTSVRVWRQELRVFQRALDAAEAAALRAALRGDDFAAVCEALADVAGDDAPERAAAILARWFADELVIGVERAGP